MSNGKASGKDWAYPRMSGGTVPSTLRGLEVMGLSPHERGNPGVPYDPWSRGGLSPHERGNLKNISVMVGGKGPIPA